MAELTALQSVPGGQINSGTAQTFNPMQGVQILAQARQRQDQIDWHNKQAALAKQKAEAEARKKAEEDEVVAEYQVAKGDYLRQPIEAMNAADIEADKQVWGTLPKAKQIQLMADRKRQFLERNEWIGTQDAAIKDVDSRLGKDYILPAKLKVDLVQTAMGDKDFSKKNYGSEYERTITSNPAFFNWENVGQRIAEKAGTLSFETIYASGTGDKKKYSQFFTGKKDPNTGLPVIDRDIAMKLIETDASAKNMKDVFIAQSLPELQKQFPNMKPDELLKVAESNAINKFFRGRGIYDVTEDLQSTAAKAKASEVSGLNLTTEPAVVDFRFTPISTMQNVTRDPVTGKVTKTTPVQAAQQVGKINFGNVQTWTATKTPIPIQSNKRVIMLSDPTDALDAGLIEENPNGGYNLKISSEASSGQIVDVHVFKKDVTNTKGGYKVRKLTPITDEYYNKMSPERRAQITETIKAYRLTPKLMTAELDEDSQKTIYKNPKIGILDVLIPIAQAGEITTTLKKEYSKPTKTAFNPFE